MSELTYQPYDAAGNRFGQLVPSPTTPNLAPACNACWDNGYVVVQCRDNSCMTLHIANCLACPAKKRRRRE